ncbi:hypothetical protein Scep_016841 [Stephania cephalantha]|uniref:Uncharacterized protein n=1 Tax=Stephania cephalantha TaxID=152367 RepID=A0AAP0NTP7_9MAGN
MILFFKGKIMIQILSWIRQLDDHSKEAMQSEGPSPVMKFKPNELPKGYAIFTNAARNERNGETTIGWVIVN